MLEDAGFATIEANGSEDALAQLERHPEISVLFTDINMPGRFDGLELARRVHGLRPSIQLVITSGRRPADPNEIPTTGSFIPKPYDAASIVSAIQAVSKGVGRRDPE